jgi:Ni/Fe-hydrogenase subunit HybB-like protein
MGHHAILFWSVQLFGLILPTLLMLFKPIRKPIPMAVIGFLVLVGSWFKRFIIVVPVQEHPYLPIQHVPEIFKVYSPTLIEIMVTIGPLVMVLMIITVLTKLFPVIPVWEMAEHGEVKENE